MALVQRRQLVNEFLPQPVLQPVDPRNTFKLVAREFYIPKKNNLKPLGEDALFICQQYQTIGVADGVGAGEYAREMMTNAVFSIEINYHEGENVDPMLVLNEAFLNTKAKGSSTACILTLKNTCSHDYLHAANIGDSGFVVIRDDKIVYKSPVQQDGFNCPYQLGNSSSFSPNSAMELVFPVVAGDIIVIGTDELFNNNVYAYEIENLVKLGMKDPEMIELPELLAWLIGKYALQRAEDDITVVVAYVRHADEFDFDALC